MRRDKASTTPSALDERRARCAWLLTYADAATVTAVEVALAETSPPVRVASDTAAGSVPGAPLPAWSTPEARPGKRRRLAVAKP